MVHGHISFINNTAYMFSIEHIEFLVLPGIMRCMKFMRCVKFMGSRDEQHL